MSGLRFEDHELVFRGSRGADDVTILRGIDLEIRRGETVGLVGESGSGKSILCLSAMGLLDRGARTRGRILLGDQDLLAMESSERRALAGRRLGMVFQDPGSSLNPFLSIGRQMTEGLRRHEAIDRATAVRRALEALDRCGLAGVERIMRRRPHALSGGQRQRVMIAMALVTEPDVIFADEPTTALDVTTQARILELLVSIQADSDVSILLVSHDLGVVGGVADRVAVMYSGRIVEIAPTDELFASPAHPYTRALLDARPRLGQVELPRGIDGDAPDPADRPAGCAFHPRCSRVDDGCDRVDPLLEELTEDRSVACPPVHDEGAVA